MVGRRLAGPASLGLVWAATTMGCGSEVVIQDPDGAPSSRRGDEAGALEDATAWVCQETQPTEACNECARRAIETACKPLRGECDDGAECVPFGQCQFECYQDAECCRDCASSYPSGHLDYAELQTCVVCDECAEECEGVFPELCSG
jgi:hypothetical protein